MYEPTLTSHLFTRKDKSTYISPSDAIMSPASQKLSSFKQRQMDKFGAVPRSRSLFATQAHAQKVQLAKTSRDKDLSPV